VVSPGGDYRVKPVLKGRAAKNAVLHGFDDLNVSAIEASAQAVARLQIDGHRIVSADLKQFAPLGIDVIDRQ
jgi:hypothetical protein